MPLTGAPCPQTNDTRAPLLKVLLLRRLTKKLIQKNWRREQLLQVIRSNEEELSAMRATHAIKIEGTAPGRFMFGGITRCRSAEDEPSQYYRCGENKSFVKRSSAGSAQSECVPRRPDNISRRLTSAANDRRSEAFVPRPKSQAQADELEKDRQFYAKVGTSNTGCNDVIERAGVRNIPCAGSPPGGVTSCGSAGLDGMGLTRQGSAAKYGQELGTRALGSTTLLAPKTGRKRDRFITC
jgi:hypothetical protein